MVLRFRVRDVFLVGGRGTAVVGVIEDGEVSAGDRLVVERSAKPTTVASVEAVRESCWTPSSPAQLDC